MDTDTTARAARFTDAQIQSKRLKPGTWLTEALGGRGAGRLVLRIAESGERLFYFRYTEPGRRQRAIALGAYARDGRAGLSLRRARDKAEELSKRYREGARDLRAQLDNERRAAAEKAAHELAERERKAIEAQRGTLRKLLEAYVAHLEQKGRQSAGDVRRIFNVHVFEAWPSYAERKASELRPGEITTVVRTVVEKGKGRTAGKLRSYMRAAYALAIKSEHDAAAPATLRHFGIEANPVADTAALSEFNRTRERALTAGELRAYLQRLEALEETPARDALLLLLYLGGQRPEQLLRVAPADVDLQAPTLVVLDPKGKRSQPRVHVLPLPARCLPIVERRLEAAGDAPWLFTSDGVRRTRVETLTDYVREISAAVAKDPVLKAAKASKGEFQLRDIRRTCETMLASLGVSRDIRGQLLSHGLGGVQVRNYDRHSYLHEKVEALDIWNAYLSRLKRGHVDPAKVVSMARVRSARRQAA
jgi:integrase